MDLSFVPLESLYGVLRPSNGGPSPVVLLGAGASVKSGIPTAAMIVERAAKSRYCRDHNRHPDDPRLTRSDWLPWLHQQPWYRRDLGQSENYPTAIWNLLQPREARKEFFLDILKTQVPPSAGYHRFVDLLAERAVMTTLTTNFDFILPDLCSSNSRLHYVEVIRTPDDYVRLSTSPTRPQIIFMHGVVENYTDRNLAAEVQRLEEGLVRELVPLLRDHPLIVIGYRGAEPSVMRHLLIEQAERASNYRHGIYWCVRKDSADPKDIHPFIHELCNTIGTNLMMVTIDGFDEFMASIPTASQRPLALANGGTLGMIGPLAVSFDMTPYNNVALTSIDWPTTQEKVIAYCERTAISIKPPIGREWLIEQMRGLDILAKSADRDVLTAAGVLLFSNEPQKHVSQAQIEIVDGEGRRLIRGNLWSQLLVTTGELDDINKPFRLKGTVSNDVTPYPPIAFKELIVNALVHRDYQRVEPVQIEVAPTFVRIVSPGGLIEEVAERLRRENIGMQDRVKSGGRGLKGYRNPVLADLFYGAGAMDKRGSGLADVYRWAKENNCELRLGPIEDNRFFEATLYCRPEAVDNITRTATPLVTTARYMTNLLEVIEMPVSVHYAGTKYKKGREIYETIGGEEPPPFIVTSGRLFSFAQLNTAKNPLSRAISVEGAGSEPVDKFVADYDERRFVWLLNECLYRHLELSGLIVDKKRKRAYFPRSQTGAREVTYQSLSRRPTRTVTKPILGRTTQEVRFWDHKAIRFGFERYGDVWAIQIVPTYVFTMDGLHKLVESTRVSRLATKRVARDYNMQVHNDLIFWSWVLSEGRDSFSLHTGASERIVIGSAYATSESRELPSTEGLGEQGADIPIDVETLEDQLAEAVEEALQASPEEVTPDETEGK
jgi:hypothetical protein